MGSVYRLTLRQLSGRWRLAIMSILAALPVVNALLALASRHAPSVETFERAVLSAVLAGSVVPLIVLAIAAPAFANEVEDRTLANLLLAPIPRWQVALPKLLAVISVAAPFAAVSAALTSWVAYTGDLRAVAAVTVAAVTAVILYAAAFTWLGLVTTQAIGIGLLYIVLWEGFFSGFVAGVRLLSIRFQSIALMHGLDARRFAEGDHLSLGAVVPLLLAVVGAFFWLSVRRLRRMDVP